jgi:hypothetical protein
MARTVRSIKGDVVDFDLFEVKRQIGEKPITMDVENRERFVYSKRKRGSKRTVEKMLKDQRDNAANARDALEAQAMLPPVVEEEAVKETLVTDKTVVKSKASPKKKKRRIIKKTK